MSETPHANPAPLIDRASFVIGVTAGSTIAGGLYGAAVANYQYPAQIPYAEGVEATASLTFSSSTTVKAPISEVVSPNVPVDTPIPGMNGLHANIDQLQLNISGKQAQGEYIGLLTNFNDSVVKPTGEAIMSHLALGAGIGASIAAGLSYGAIRYARRIRHEAQETEADIAALRFSQSRAGYISATRQEKKLIKEANRRKWVAASAAAVLAITAGNTARHAVEVEATPSNGDEVALADILVDQVPELRGTKIIGGGDQINSVIFGINNLKERADKPWQKGRVNMTKALKNYYAGPGKAYQLNPDIVTVAHVTDLHCNLANYSYYFGPLMKQLQPNVVALTGDTQTNSGTMFYEKNCLPGLQKIVRAAGQGAGRTIPIVNASGNHDNKDRYHGGSDFYDLNGKHHTAEVAAGDSTISFVGQQDPRSTVWYPTKPVSLQDQNRALANQGKSIQSTACNLYNQGKTVIVMTHARQASYPVITRGCASLVLNGHTHHEQAVEGFQADNNNLVLQHTGGSASGADAKLSIYEGPEQDASTTMFYYSQSQRRFVGYYTVTMHKNSQVEIQARDLPPAPQVANELDNMKAFETTYAGGRPNSKSKTLADNPAP